MSPQPGPPRDEFVPEDDAVIGRALRWSLLVLALLVAGVFVLRLLLEEPEPPPPPPAAPYVPPRAASQEVTPPALPFRDVTLEAGITFRHENGARGEKLLPETMGAGCAFLDADGDGDQDLLLVNSTRWPGDPPAEGPPPTSALYLNDGTGHFQDVSRAWGLDVEFYGTGCAVGDADNDGDVDLYLAALGPNLLLRNDGGHFQDVTAEAGVAGAPDAWSTAVAFLDVEDDGDLDLFVGNYVRWSRPIDLELDFRLTGVGRAYGPPMNFEGAHPVLYRNEGGLRFTDVSEPAGMRVANPATGVPVAKTLGVVPVDVDEDGDLDLVVANDTVRNFLFLNRGDGSFEDAGDWLGVAFDRNGNATGAMGIDAARYRNDGALAVAIGNFANEMSSLYVREDPAGPFTDEAIGEGLGAPSRRSLSFGLLFLDLDLDGRLDLLQANGHLEQDIAVVQASQSYEQAPQLFWNAGDASRGCFVEVPAETTGDLGRPLVGRALSAADIDGDGDLDLVLTQAGRPPVLLRNDQATGHHWLRVRLVGAGRNRDALGARVLLTADGVTQERVVMPTRSYLSQVELPVTFGLGQATEVTALEVHWPDGTTQQVEVPGVDRLLVVEQG